MAERWFLKIDGIPGESTDVVHKDEIDVQSWSWGMSQSSAGPGGGGGGAGKASFGDLQFVSRISKASPALFLACASGSHLKSATLSGVRGAGNTKGGAEFLTVKLTDLRVTSQALGDAPDAEPAEQFSLNFTKIEWTFIQRSATGAPLPPVTAGWDVLQNKKI